jgi:hypothetical protein
MDVDDENLVDKVQTNEDDDSVGGYVLDIDIDGLEYKQIWVRAEYLRIYDYFETRYHNVINLPGTRVPGAVLTGNPGIGMLSHAHCYRIKTNFQTFSKGKSVFIFYAVRRRLAEQKPVIWVINGVYYLFVEEGVYKMPEHFYRVSRFRYIVWTFVAADHNGKGIPPSLIAHGTPLFVIYVTSPAKERWDRMYHTIHETVVVMNPWTRKEIHRA